MNDRCDFYSDVGEGDFRGREQVLGEREGEGQGKGGKCRALVADRVPLLTVSITRVTASPTSRVAADDASKLVRRLNEESRRPRRRPGGNYFLRGGSGGGGGGTALIAVSADSFCGVALMRCACPSVRPSVRPCVACCASHFPL